jgi:hypothetical protein
LDDFDLLEVIVGVAVEVDFLRDVDVDLADFWLSGPIENPAAWCRRTLTRIAAIKEIREDSIGAFLLRFRWTGSKLIFVFDRWISRSPSLFIFIFIALLSIIVVLCWLYSLSDVTGS